MKRYSNIDNSLAITFDKEKCTHCANCVNTLPNTFELGRRPWIKLDSDTKEDIVRVVGECPSGALMVAT